MGCLIDLHKCVSFENYVYSVIGLKFKQFSSKTKVKTLSRAEVSGMGSLCDDTVVICHGEKKGEPSVISVSCLDKIGLGCDLCRAILFYGLSIVKGDFVTDGEWCYMKFWVIGKPTIRWDSLKKTMINACPLRPYFTWIHHDQPQQLPKQPDVFLLTIRAFDRNGLEYGVAEVVCALNLLLRRWKISYEPDAKVVKLYLTDTRELLHTEERQEETRDRLKDYLGDVMISCEIGLVNSETTCCSGGASFIVPPSMTEDSFSLQLSGCSMGSFATDVSPSPATYYHKQEVPKPDIPDVFLVKFCAMDRKGILHDVLEVFHVLGLVVRSTKASTTPDGTVVDFFIITDTRGQLHTEKRKKETYRFLKVKLGDVMISCNIQSFGNISCSERDHYSFGLDEELGVADWVGTSSAIIEDMFSFLLSDEHSMKSSHLTVTTDNTFPSHTLIEISCKNRKGLLYDITRTLKYLDIQICYARFFAENGNRSEVELFVKQKDGNKIVDPKIEMLIDHCLQMEILCPVRVSIAKHGPYTELQVANPVDLSGMVRPLDIYDLSLALKKLDINTIAVVMMSHVIRKRVSGVYLNQEWEVYRICLSKGDDMHVSWSKIKGELKKRLMGWE